MPWDQLIPFVDGKPQESRPSGFTYQWADGRFHRVTVDTNSIEWRPNEIWEDTLTLRTVGWRNRLYCHSEHLGTEISLFGSNLNTFIANSVLGTLRAELTFRKQGSMYGVDIVETL